MYSKCIFLTALLIACCLHTIEAQYTISGTVTDANGQPLDLVLISLVSAQDSVARKSELTDATGQFELNHNKPGSYWLQANLLGYATTISPVLEWTESMTSLPALAIQLETADKVLSDVTVTAKVPYVQRKADRVIVTVDALAANASSNVLEALERAPGISTDPGGLLKLKGREGVLVLIDDKPTYLSGAELENYLRSLPAGSVKQFEIMTNPPAKYDAAGSAGVINIVMKRNKLAGFHGNTVLSVTRGQYTRSNNSLNLNYNTKKLGITANINGGVHNSFQDLNINRYYKNPDLTPLSSFTQNSYIEKTNQSINGKLGLDYYLSDRTSFGISAKGLTNPGENNTDNKAQIRDATGNILQRVNADNRTDNTFQNGTFTMYLKQALDTIGSSLTVDADYVLYTSGSEQLFKNSILNSEGNLTAYDEINGDLPSDIKIYAAKADYARPLSKVTNLEAGVKSAFTKTDNEAAYTNTLNGMTTIDYDLSNQFLYDEWINAAYLNFSTSYKSVSLQLGLRGEHTSLTGDQLGNPIKPDSTFERSYTNLFPTAYLTWNADSLGKHVFSFSYGKRVDRPYFQFLNPFVSPLDKFTFYVGNPNLLPTFSHNFSLTYSFNNFMNTSLSYSKTTDGINETLEIRDQIYFSRPSNVETNHSFSLSIDAAVPVTKWYSINTYGELGHQRFSGPLYTEQLDSKGTYYYLMATNSFQLGKGWSADVRGDYQSDIVYAQLLIKSFGTLNLSLQKKILNNAGNLKLSFNDILYTRRSDGVINNLQLTDADWNSDLDTRNVALAFSYRFGKATGGKPKHQSTGSESEQNRVRG